MKTDQGLECWGVCIVATLIQALSIGLENSYGAVQTDFMRHFGINQMSSMAMVGAISDGTSLLISPLVALVAKKLGYHWTSMIGSTMVVISMLLCAIVTSYESFLCSYGILMGVGLGFVILPSATVCAFYFNKRKGLTISITNSGAGLGTVVLPILFGWVIPAYGVNGVFVTIGLSFAITIPLTYIFYPSFSQLKLRLSELNPKLLDSQRSSDSEASQDSLTAKSLTHLDMLKDPKFWIFASAVFFAGGTSVAVTFYLPKMSQDLLETSDMESRLLLSILGASKIVGHFIAGWLSDKTWVSPTLVYGLGCLVNAICALSYAFASSFWIMAGIVLANGLFRACNVNSIAALEVFGVRKITFATGLYTFVFGIGIFALLPSTALFYEWLGRSYLGATLLMSSFYAIGSIAAFVTFAMHKKSQKDNPDRTDPV